MSITYANGAAPDSALAWVDGLHTVPSIVPRVNDLIAYARTQGRLVRVAHWYGSYRNLHEQNQISGTGNSGSTIPVAAVGKSTHGVYGTGRVDFVGADGFTYNTALLAWIVANAGRFGLAREFGNADPNHFMAVGSYTPAAPEQPQETDMLIFVKRTQNGGDPWYVTDGLTRCAVDSNGITLFRQLGLVDPNAGVKVIGDAIDRFIDLTNGLPIDTATLAKVLAPLLNDSTTGATKADLADLAKALDTAIAGVPGLVVQKFVTNLSNS